MSITLLFQKRLPVSFVQRLIPHIAVYRQTSFSIADFLTPIAAHSLASRALVFSDREPVTVFPATPERLMMVVDGSAGCYVWPEDRVLVRRSEHPVRFVRLADHEFFQVLRNKLGWGLPHVAKPGNGQEPS